LFQSRPVPAFPLADRLRTGAGRRALGVGAAVAIEALLVLLLLTLGPGWQVEVEKTSTVVLNVHDVPEEAPEARRPERRAEARPETQRPEPRQPAPPQPAQPPATPPTPPAPAIIPMRWSLAPGVPRPPAAPTRPLYGPPDNRSVMFRDTERVGTAPNGEPLYAAEWYREPDDDMMRAYLSGARGPGWGLIACRTASDFRVEDCVGLGEYPEGSQIMRSALAAAWEFRVRPPRRGGQVLIGSWVRIRIDYDYERHRR
jgi:protein TonB